eukprot:1159718-Pelagomonas_calceolata.AAC.7
MKGESVCMFRVSATCAWVLAAGRTEAKVQQTNPTSRIVTMHGVSLLGEVRRAGGYAWASAAQFLPLSSANAFFTLLLQAQKSLEQCKQVRNVWRRFWSRPASPANLPRIQSGQSQSDMEDYGPDPPEEARYVTQQGNFTPSQQLF